MNLEKMKDAAKAAIEAAKEENPNKIFPTITHFYHP